MKYDEFQPTTLGERNAMYGISILGMIASGGESGEARLISAIGNDKGLVRLAEEAELLCRRALIPLLHSLLMVISIPE